MSDGLLPVIETQAGLDAIKAIYETRWKRKFDEQDALVARLREVVGRLNTIFFDGRTKECQQCAETWVETERHTDDCPIPTLNALLAEAEP